MRVSDRAVSIRIAVVDDVDSCAALACLDGAGDREEWRSTFERTVADGWDRVLCVADTGPGIVGYARAVRLAIPPDTDRVLPAGWYLLGASALGLEPMQCDRLIL